MIENLIQEIDRKFGDGLITILDVGKQTTLNVPKELILDLCLFLRDHPSFYFDFLSNITAVDYHPDHRFAVVYNLASIPNQFTLTLRVELDNESRTSDFLPEISSVSSVWRTADWHEREAFDLMGIFFTNHPDLRRILLPDDWQGFPLRKDYEDPEMYHGINIKN
jgi:NADH-quinone oxidoreductase subunit C